MPDTQMRKREASDPWTEVDRAFEELRNRFFSRFGGSPIAPFFGSTDSEPSLSIFRPAITDISDTGKSFKVTAEIPGIPKDKLEIRVLGTNVEIRGEQQSTTEEKKGDEYVARERTYAGFYRSIELPEPVKAQEAKAKVENGLLELELPKEQPTPSPEPVKVSVQ